VIDPGGLSEETATEPVGIAMVGGLLGENGPGINSSYRRLEPMDELTQV
jgi:hypothetical protein